MGMRLWPSTAPAAEPDSDARPLPDGEAAGRATFRARHVVEAREASGLVPHANNVAILGWIDRLAELHGDHARASRASLADDGRMWFVARHEVDYLGETFVGDELELLTWVERLGRTSLHRSSRIFILSGDAPPRLVVRATSRWALVDLASRRPTPIPEPVRRIFLGGHGHDPRVGYGPSDEKTPFDQETERTGQRGER